MEGWRQCLLGKEKTGDEQTQQIYLTPTGLLMEGVTTSMRFFFANFGQNRRTEGANMADAG